MNIFKKKLKNSLFQKVETRVMLQMKNNIPSDKKELNQFCLASLLLCGSIIGGVFCLNRLNIVSTFFEQLMFFTSSMGMLFIVSFYINHRYSLYHLSQQHSIYESAYQSLSRYSDYNSIQSLTSEEIQELLSLSLNSKQIAYLQKTILENEIFTIDNLCHLNSLNIDEEKNSLEQEKLNIFLSQHQLPPHPYMKIQQDKDESEIEKEAYTNLSSRL